MDSEVCFAPKERLKWISIDRMKFNCWETEQYFTLKIDAVTSGSMSIGTLSQCCVTLTDPRGYPGLVEKIPLHKKRGQIKFVVKLLQEFMYRHTVQNEFKRVLWVIYEAFYASVAKTFLYTIWLVDVCIKGEFWQGLVVIAVLEGFDITMQRLSKERQFVTGSVGLRMGMHAHTISKITRPTYQAPPEEVNNLFLGVHTQSVDVGVGAVYFSCYSIFKMVLQLVFSIVYVFVSGFAGDKQWDSRALLYTLAALVFGISGNIYFGFFWHRRSNWEHALTSELVQRDRLDRAISSLSVRKTVKAFDMNYLSKKYTDDFNTSTKLSYQFVNVLGLHQVDAIYLASAFGDTLVVALTVVLALIHIESVAYGVGRLSLGTFLALVRVAHVLNNSSSQLCNQCRDVYVGCARLNSLRELLDAETTVVPRALQLQSRLEHMGLQQGNVEMARALPHELVCEFRQATVMPRSGLKCSPFEGSVPLGKTYVLKGKAWKNRRKPFFGLFQGSLQPAAGEVNLPPFVRCVNIGSRDLIPHTFYASAIENALLFADRSRYTEHHAREILKALNVFDHVGLNWFSSTGTASAKSLDDVVDPYVEELNPNTLPSRKRVLIVLAQVLLADPEVILLDMDIIPHEDDIRDRVLSALLAWHSGGPTMVLQAARLTGHTGLSMRSLAKSWSCVPELRQDLCGLGTPLLTAQNGYPSWFQTSNGGIHRTLVLDMRFYGRAHEMQRKEFFRLCSHAMELDLLEDGTLSVHRPTDEARPIDEAGTPRVQDTQETALETQAGVPSEAAESVLISTI
jgi:ABC-type multidrug transport system fused ATPase/permease subunit